MMTNQYHIGVVKLQTDVSGQRLYIGIKYPALRTRHASILAQSTIYNLYIRVAGIRFDPRDPPADRESGDRTTSQEPDNFARSGRVSAF
ncbi:MAG: hypothetical protein JWO19_4278 [Bryobacterales bacterium]|jgi:hypothetical protein|nr:hypothetical protein [Bryobacterales bacterium]